MEIEKQHLNVQNKLFGGVTASLIDVGGSLAIAAHNSSIETGVSANIDINYLRGGNLHDILRVESSCVKSGKNLAFTKVDIFVHDKLIAFGSHTKFINFNKQ